MGGSVITGQLEAATILPETEGREGTEEDCLRHRGKDWLRHCFKPSCGIIRY